MKFASVAPLIVCLMVSVASAQEAAPQIFEALGTSQDLTPAQQAALDRIHSSPLAGKIDLVRINQEALSASTARMEFGDHSFLVVSEGLKDKGAYSSWIASITDNGAPSSQQSILTIEDGNFAGSIISGSDVYLVRPLGGGAHAIYELKREAIPEEHPPIQNRGELRDLIENQNKDSPIITTVIDLLVLYTPAANLNNTFGSMTALVQQAEEETNRSFSNSNINAEVRVIHIEQISHVETDYDSDVDALKTMNDGIMDDVHTLRDEKNSDAVILIVNNDDYCGVAYEIGATRETAFALVHHDCATGYFSFGHELGHLLGAMHNEEADSTSGFAHGWYIEPRAWRSVMSYDCPTSCTRYPNWSNPNIRLSTGESTGDLKSADNARQLNDASPVFSSFY